MYISTLWRGCMSKTYRYQDRNSEVLDFSTEDTPRTGTRECWDEQIVDCTWPVFWGGDGGYLNTDKGRIPFGDLYNTFRLYE